MSTTVRPRRSRRTLRIRHNLAAGVAVVVGAAVLDLLLPDELVNTQRASILLGYASLGYLLLTLSLGPRNVLQGRRNPVSNDLRRDLGIWAGVTGVAHVVLSLQHHFGGSVMTYFFASGSPSVGDVRKDAFGAGVYLGTLATVILVVLLAVSNDRALRRLGRRWKRLQRANYGLAALAMLHTVAFWITYSRTLRVQIPVAAAAAAVLVLQSLGVARYRRLRLKT